MVKKLIMLFVFSISILSCEQQTKIDADSIIDKAIEVSGGHLFEASTINFDFRNRHYKAIRNNGVFQYERMFTDSLGGIKDVLSNSGFKRFFNDSLIQVQDSMIPRYSSSINSVHYFSVLPFGLNDVAVHKSYLGKTTIKNSNYYKIRIAFNEAGGGEDFEDIFIYWIHSETFKADFIAYSYSESDGLGLRFREAYNERFINGIRFVDYNNYKPKNSDRLLGNLDRLFDNDSLELLSKIELENVRVEF